MIRPCNLIIRRDCAGNLRLWILYWIFYLEQFSNDWEFSTHNEIFTFIIKKLNMGLYTTEMHLVRTLRYLEGWGLGSFPRTQIRHELGVIWLPFPAAFARDHTRCIEQLNIWSKKKTRQHQSFDQSGSLLQAHARTRGPPPPRRLPCCWLIPCIMVLSQLVVQYQCIFQSPVLRSASVLSARTFVNRSL
jgi:hypothetical protein